MGKKRATLLQMTWTDDMSVIYISEQKTNNTESVSADGEESATSQLAGSCAAIGAANQGSLLGLAVYFFFWAKYLIASLLA